MTHVKARAGELAGDRQAVHDLIDDIARKLVVQVQTRPPVVRQRVG